LRHTQLPEPARGIRDCRHVLELSCAPGLLLARPQVQAKLRLGEVQP